MAQWFRGQIKDPASMQQDVPEVGAAQGACPLMGKQARLGCQALAVGRTAT